MFDKLGIDWKLLCFQVVNFFLLLLILRKVLYKPVLRLLDERRKKIEDGLAKSEKFEEEWQKIKEMEKEKAAQSEKAALQVMEKARLDGQAKEKEILELSRLKSDKIIEEAKKDIVQEKEKMLEELKGEASEFIVFATEKILKKTFTEKEEKEVLKETIDLIKKNDPST